MTTGQARSVVEVGVLAPVVSIGDAAAVAFQRAMSNGSISRRLGWAAVVLLPLTFPAQIQLVLLGGSQVMRTRRGSLQRGRTAHVRASAVVASIGFVLLICVYLALAVFALGLPGWLVYSAFLVLVVIEMAGAIMAAAVRRGWRALTHQHGPHDLNEVDAVGGSSPVSITFVAAFPRGRGGGSELMAGLEALLDETGATAELTARTAGLLAFYERHGFRSLGGDPRRMLRKPRSIKLRPSRPQSAASEATTAPAADTSALAEVTRPSSRL